MVEESRENRFHEAARSELNSNRRAMPMEEILINKENATARESGQSPFAEIERAE